MVTKKLKVSLGQQVNDMYLRLASKDESTAVHFVDTLGEKQKMALSRYWKQIGRNDLRQMYFKSLDGQAV